MEPVNATRTFLSDERGWPSARIELYDVQGLWGGRRIVVDGGRAVVQIVGRGLFERRFALDLSQADLRRLLEAFVQNDFVTIQPADRPGIPDEAHPSITLTNSSGEAGTVSKWAGVKDERFDAVYAAIVQLEELTQGLEPIYSGPFTPAA